MAPKRQPGWRIYKEEMDFLCYGDALWQPAPASNNSRIRIGDVGFIRRGRFHLLFSAGCPLGERMRGPDVPDTFEELNLGSPTSAPPRQPGCLRTDTVRELGAGGSTVPGPHAAGTSAQFSFELTGNRGAALVTKYSTYNEDSLVDSAFVKYTKQHYESWVKFARDKQYGDDIQPILVSGFDVTRDFAMVAYSYEGTPRTADSIIRVPEVGLTPGSLWGTWRTSFSPHTNSGPHSQSQPTTSPPPQSAEVAGIPSEFDQCVFIRYYSMRSRGPFFMFPKVIRAGAGPHDPGSGNRESGAPPRLVVQPEDEPVTSGEEGVGVQWRPAVGDSDSETDVVIRNAPSGDEYDNWDAIAKYVFQNSDADFVVMHHRDLAGLYMAERTDNMATLLEKRRPQIVVDADGVGRIICQGPPRPGTPSPTTTRTIPHSHSKGPVSHRLYNLERKSAQFPEQLEELLGSEQWTRDIEVLLEDEIRELIVCLDEILDTLDSTGAPFRKCLRVLMEICSSRMILPPTYELSGDLSFNADQPVVYGQFCNAYEGTYGSAKVFIEKFPAIPRRNLEEKLQEALYGQAVVWKHLDHPNIVPFRGVTFQPLQIVWNWVPGGNLREYINQNPQVNLTNLLLGAAKGLAYLHSRNVVHRDFKGANILIDEGGNARIVDFGLATIARFRPTGLGPWSDTARFTAPEILNGEKRRSKESDVFAFGMVMIEVFTGRLPFSDCNPLAVTVKIMNGCRPERPIHPGFTDDLWALTQRCWEEIPQDRPQMDSIMNQLVPYEAVKIYPLERPIDPSSTDDLRALEQRHLEENPQDGAQMDPRIRQLDPYEAPQMRPMQFVQKHRDEIPSKSDAGRVRPPLEHDDSNAMFNDATPDPKKHKQHRLKKTVATSRKTLARIFGTDRPDRTQETPGESSSVHSSAGSSLPRT